MNGSQNLENEKLKNQKPLYEKFKKHAKWMSQRTVENLQLAEKIWARLQHRISAVIVLPVWRHSITKTKTAKKKHKQSWCSESLPSCVTKSHFSFPFSYKALCEGKILKQKSAANNSALATCEYNSSITVSKQQVKRRNFYSALSQPSFGVSRMWSYFSVKWKQQTRV